MSNMAFGVKCVRDFLAEKGYVLTVRGYDYHTEFAKVADLDNATVQRVKVCEIKQESDLTGFVPLSGFETAREWSKQINIFCKGRKWLYRVSIIDDDTYKQEREYEEREHERAYNLLDDTHPLDIRASPEIRDPALVNLQPFKDAAQVERLRQDEENAERKRNRLREIYGEQMYTAPTQDTHDPDKIKTLSNAEMALKALCNA